MWIVGGVAVRMAAVMVDLRCRACPTYSTAAIAGTSQGDWPRWAARPGLPSPPVPVRPLGGIPRLRAIPGVPRSTPRPQLSPALPSRSFGHGNLRDVASGVSMTYSTHSYQVHEVLKLLAGYLVTRWVSVAVELEERPKGRRRLGRVEIRDFRAESDCSEVTATVATAARAAAPGSRPLDAGRCGRRMRLFERRIQGWYPIYSHGCELTLRDSTPPGAVRRDRMAGRVVDRVLEAAWGRSEDRADDEHYALLDGARDRRISHLIKGGEVDSCCLYEGMLPSDLAEVAPYLVALSRRSPLTTRLIQLGWGQELGVVPLLVGHQIRPASPLPSVATG